MKVKFDVVTRQHGELVQLAACKSRLHAERTKAKLRSEGVHAMIRETHVNDLRSARPTRSDR